MQPLQVQTLSLLSELLEIFQFNRKLILFNCLLLFLVIFTGIRNYLSTRKTTTMVTQILASLEQMDTERAESDATELNHYRSGQK